MSSVLIFNMEHNSASPENIDSDENKTPSPRQYVSEYYYFGQAWRPTSSDDPDDISTPPHSSVTPDDDMESNASADSFINEGSVVTTTTTISNGKEDGNSGCLPAVRIMPSSLLQEIRQRAVKGWAMDAIGDLTDMMDNLRTRPGRTYCQSGDNSSRFLTYKNSNGSSQSDRTDSASPVGSELDDSSSLGTNSQCSTASLHSCEMEDVYEFHLRENEINSEPEKPTDDLSFVGYKDIFGPQKGGTIRSHNGTVRGVRNRVRAGIATFLQSKTTKSYLEREQGKVVVYTSTMGIVRETSQRCMKVRRILRTLLIRYEERDVFMNREVQLELMERMNTTDVSLPQVFLQGQHLGDAETIEKLNETGDLRRILRHYKRNGPEIICDKCGGYRYIPCTVCNGSKKSIHRNHFTTEFVALKCMSCNEAGLVRCSLCADLAL